MAVKKWGGLPARRGLALITVLIAASLLAMLCVSLVVISRTGLLTSEQFRRRQALLQTCYSGLDYAKVRLAQPGGWGTLPFSTNHSDSDLKVRESLDVVDGTLKATGATFQLRVVNNLQGLTRLSPPSWCVTGVEIAPHTALVAVDATLEGAHKRMEVVLVRDSLLTSAVFSGGDLAVEVPMAGSPPPLNVSSVVPRGTSVKAGGQVYLPDPSKVVFQPRGQLHSSGDVFVNSTFSVDTTSGNLTGPGGTSLKSNAALKTTASSTMSATVHTDSDSGLGKFNPGKLQTPAGPTVYLNPGEYRFVAANVVVYEPDNPSLRQTFNGSIGSGAVLLKDYRFMPDPNRRVEVPGNFTLTANITAHHYTPPGTGSLWGTITGAEFPEPYQASLGLGYDSLGQPQGSKAQNRFLVTGNLTISGDVVGSGQLMVGNSTQGGRLTVKGNSFLSGTRTNDLALVAHDSVILGDVSNQARELPFAALPGDLEAFGAAVYGANSTHSSTLQNFTAASSASLSLLSTSLIEQSIGTSGLYSNNVLSKIAQGVTFSGGGVMTNGTLGGIDLAKVPVHDHSAHNTTTVSVLDAINEYVSSLGGNVTLKDHLHVREYLKSVEAGEFKTWLIDPGNTAWSDDPNLANVTYNEMRSRAINQVSAYNQDARAAGAGLLAYLPNALGATTIYGDPYLEPRRFDFAFGGILYGKNNILVNLGSQFRLLGSMITENPLGAISFKGLQKGSLVFDPTACQDQFDWTKLGLVPIFFWTD